MLFLSFNALTIFLRYTGDKLWFKAGTETPKTRVKFLPEKYRKLFANKQIVCVEYQDITDADEREIFQVRIERSSYHHFITK